jgi:hypothetical protein
MYPTQLAAEAMAAHGGFVWELLPELLKQAYLDAADAACKRIVAGEDGWRIARVASTHQEYDDDRGSPTSDQLVDVWTIAEEWTCD